MSHKEKITNAMDALAADQRTRFVGYGLKRGRGQGTLANVPEAMLLEHTIAENCMTGVAIGLSMMGLLPVVVFERFDFVPCALDAIVNHTDKIDAISQSEFSPAIIFRVIVGNSQKPLFTGPTHTQNLTAGMRAMVKFPVIELRDERHIVFAYEQAQIRQQMGVSTMLVEFKDNA